MGGEELNFKLNFVTLTDKLLTVEQTNFYRIVYYLSPLSLCIPIKKKRKSIILCEHLILDKVNIHALNFQSLEDGEILNILINILQFSIKYLPCGHAT